MHSEAVFRRVADWAATQPCAKDMIARKRGDWIFAGGVLDAEGGSDELELLRLWLTPAGRAVHLCLIGPSGMVTWRAPLPKGVRP